MKSKIATTVKIEKNLYDSFKILGIQNNLTLQTFVEKCVYLYVNDNSFKSAVNNFVFPVLSGVIDNNNTDIIIAATATIYTSTSTASIITATSTDAGDAASTVTATTTGSVVS